MRATRFLKAAALGLSLVLMAACGRGGAAADGDRSPAPGGGSKVEAPSDAGEQDDAVQLSGLISVDGSSTVFPITEAMAEEFQAMHPDVRITVGVSGTGGGFEKFCAGETVISDASRPIKASEHEACAANGIEYIELPVAFDGLSVLVNPENDWVDAFTIDELRKIWEPGAQGVITRWSQVRPQWPDAPINLYGPGTDSGTFDYFTDVVNGEEGASRGDYTASEDDNVLVQGIAGDVNALGYFGYAYYVANQDSLRAVPIVNPETGQAVAPSEQTINDGTYAPLSRPIYIYVNAQALGERPEVAEFVRYYLTEGTPLVAEVGYVELPQEIYDLALARVENRVTGTMYGEGSEGKTLLELMAGGR